MTYKTEVQKIYKKIAQQMGIQAPPLKIGGSNNKRNAVLLKIYYLFRLDSLKGCFCV